jgi:hypothetical protein
MGAAAVPVILTELTYVAPETQLLALLRVGVDEDADAVALRIRLTVQLNCRWLLIHAQLMLSSQTFLNLSTRLIGD